MKTRYSFAIVLALALAVAAWATMYETSSDADLTATETANGSQLGYAVAMGDLNGDGVDDAIVSEPGFYDGPVKAQQCFQGRIRVYWGNDDENVDLVIKTTGDTMTQCNWFLGGALAIGDVNGDGVDDLIYSAPSANTEPIDFVDDARTGQGIVFVTYGGSDLNSVSEIVLDPYQIPVKAPQYTDVQIYNDIAGSLELSYGFGDYLASGDVNGDGFDDIIAFNFWQNELISDSIYQQRNLVYVIYGSGSLPAEAELSLFDDYDIRFSGNPYSTFDSTYDALGEALAGGEVTGDEYDDVVIGAPGGVMYGGISPAYLDGTVFVFEGRSNADWIAADVDTTAPAQFNLALPAERAKATMRVYGHVDSQENLGGAVTVGDMDGDGTGDVIMGAPQIEKVFPPVAAVPPVLDEKTGNVYAIWGGPSLPAEWQLAAATPADLSVEGEDTAQVFDMHFGHHLATGDMNGDCIDDLLVGLMQGNETEVARMAYAILGSDMFPAQEVLSMPGDAEHIIDNDDGGSGPFEWDAMLSYGYCVDVAMGDWNGNLVADLMAGTPDWKEAPPAQSSMVGRAWVFNTIENLPPEADAEPETQERAIGETAEFTGTVSDPEGDEITFAWTQVSGPNAPLAGDNTLTPTMVPPEAGTYVYRLTVTDCLGRSASDDVEVIVPEEGDDDVADEDTGAEDLGFYGSGGCGTDL